MQNDLPPQDINNQVKDELHKKPTLYPKRWPIIALFVIVFIIGGTYFLLGNTFLQWLWISQIEETRPSISQKKELPPEPRKYYKIKNDAVYYYYQKIIDADSSTFQELGDGWAKDKNYTFYEGSRIYYDNSTADIYRARSKPVSLDPATIKVDPLYVSDKFGVWFYGTGRWRGIKPLPDADLSTFSVISRLHGKDSNNIYYGAQKIEGADVLSFTIAPHLNQDDWYDLYATDKNNVYYGSSLIKGADTKSFIYLGNEYAADKNHVYFKETVLPGADINSFILVSDYFAKDKTHIFSAGEMLDIEIDPASVKLVGSFIKDGQRVYQEVYYGFNDENDPRIELGVYGEIKYNLIPGIDAPTFQYVGICGSVEKFAGNYYRDKNRVFVESESIDSIDASSFQYLGEYGVAAGLSYTISYAKDKDVVYHSCGEILEDADTLTFTALEDGYAKDKNNVWYLADIISTADTATLQSLGGGYAKDKLRVYFAGFVVQEADVATFSIVKEQVAKDKNYVYFENKIIEGVNPTNCTIESIENCNPDLYR